MKQKVIVIGRNYTSRLGMIRAVGMAGYDVTVIKTNRYPVLEDIDATNDKGLKVVQINVDEYPDIAGAYGVQSIPNLILFKDGKDVNQAIGFMNKDQLLAKLSADLD